LIPYIHIGMVLKHRDNFTDTDILPPDWFGFYSLHICVSSCLTFILNRTMKYVISESGVSCGACMSFLF